MNFVNFESVKTQNADGLKLNNVDFMHQSNGLQSDDTFVWFPSKMCIIIVYFQGLSACLSLPSPNMDKESKLICFVFYWGNLKNTGEVVFCSFRKGNNR